MLRTLLIASNAITLVLFHYERIHARHLEGKVLRMKLSPHFLFNRLSDLHSLYYPLDVKASEIILDIATHTRYQIRHIDSPKVPLSIEMEHIRQSINFFSKNLDPSTEIQFNYSSTATEKPSILPCLFDDVLYNCFKYAKRRNGYIFINISINSQHKLCLHCINNYEYDNVHSTQNGMDILVRLLHIYYPHRHSVKTSHDDEYHTIAISLQLN